jgi:hypothetical protein
MIDDIAAKEKARVFRKFKDEQNIRMGAEKSTPMALIMSGACYYLSKRFLKIEKIPYRMIIGLGGYMFGVNLGAKTFGDPHYHVYYTQKEFDILG